MCLCVSQRWWRKISLWFPLGLRRSGRNESGELALVLSTLLLPMKRISITKGQGSLWGSVLPGRGDGDSSMASFTQLPTQSNVFFYIHIHLFRHLETSSHTQLHALHYLSRFCLLLSSHWLSGGLSSVSSLHLQSVFQSTSRVTTVKQSFHTPTFPQSRCLSLTCRILQSDPKLYIHLLSLLLYTHSAFTAVGYYLFSGHGLCFLIFVTFPYATATPWNAGLYCPSPPPAPSLTGEF